MYNELCAGAEHCEWQDSLMNLFGKDSATANVNRHSRSLIIEYEYSPDSGTPFSFVFHNALPRALKATMSSFGHGYLRRWPFVRVISRSKGWRSRRGGAAADPTRPEAAHQRARWGRSLSLFLSRSPPRRDRDGFSQSAVTRYDGSSRS